MVCPNISTVQTSTCITLPAGLRVRCACSHPGQDALPIRRVLQEALPGSAHPLREPAGTLWPQ